MGSLQAFPQRANIPELWDSVFRIQGNGAADPTVEIGGGATIKWISTGLYELTWGEFPGKFVGLDSVGFEATTASALKGYTATAGNFNATTLKLRISITNAADTLADLQVAQWAVLIVKFKETGV